MSRSLSRSPPYELKSFRPENRFLEAFLLRSIHGAMDGGGNQSQPTKKALTGFSPARASISHQRPNAYQASETITLVEVISHGGG
jgi:hypothetical protein